MGGPGGVKCEYYYKTADYKKPPRPSGRGGLILLLSGLSLLMICRYRQRPGNLLLFTIRPLTL